MNQSTTASSPRELLQLAIYEQLDPEKFNAPYGIIRAKDPSNKFRTITFGIARSLDAEIRIYGAKFFLLTWETTRRTVAHHGKEKFESSDQLLRFINKNF